MLLILWFGDVKVGCLLLNYEYYDIINIMTLLWIFTQ